MNEEACLKEEPTKRMLQKGMLLMGLILALVAGLTVVSMRWLTRIHPAPPWKVFVGILLPTLPVGLVYWAVLRRLRDREELLRLREFARQVGIGLGLNVVAAIAVIEWFKWRHPAAPWRYIAALIQMLPVMIIARASIRHVRSMDELQQKMVYESVVFAFMASAILTLAYGMLESYGMPRVSWIYVLPVMVLCLAVGRALSWARYW